MTKRLMRFGAIGAAATLLFAPVVANSADPVVARADATALILGIAGNNFDTGVVAATNTGKGEVKTGEVTPPIGVLGNQDVLDIGVLVQDATAKVQNRNGISEACSGVAGDGGQVATVGESNCITPGSPVGISLANLDLTQSILIDPASALGGLAPLNAIMPQLVGPLTNAISDGLAPLGATGLEGTLGAVEARCNARPGSATGEANIVDTALTLSIAGTSVPLVEFPANPPPNTKVLTNLDVVLNTVIDALRVDINNTLDGALAPLSAIIDPIQDQIVNELIAQIAPQLAPLEENILDVTLNKQTKPKKGAIEVTAIDLKLLPAASQFGQPPLVTAEIAKVSCGVNGRTAAPDNPDNPDNPDLPDVPTTVDSGVGGNGMLAPWTLLGMAAVTTAGVFGLRRLLVRA